MFNKSLVDLKRIRNRGGTTRYEVSYAGGLVRVLDVTETDAEVRMSDSELLDEAYRLVKLMYRCGEFSSN